MNEQPTGHRRALVGVRIIFAIWLVLTGIGTAFPGLRLWGLHLPAFLPSWWQIIFFGAAVAFLVTPVQSLGRIAQAIPRPFARIVTSPLAAIILAAAFIIFRVSAGLLGDGTLRGREAQLGITRPAEVLNGYLASWVYDVVHPVFGLSGQDAVAVLSIIAGCGFLLLLWFFPRRIWADPSDRLTARMILTLCGATALFFGYIESYAIPLTAMIGFLFAAEAYLRKKGSFFTCVVFFVLAIAGHLAAVVLFPALIALSLADQSKRLWRLTAAGAIGLAAAAWSYWAFHVSIFALEASPGSMLVPLLPQPPVNYGMVSPAHLLDIVSLILLVCPGVVIAIPLFLSGRISRPLGAPQYFRSLAVIIPLSILLLLDPKLGMARDWDLLTIGLIPLCVYAAVYLADIRFQLPRGALALPVFASAAVLVTFVGVNTHPPAAVARFEQLLELDKVRGGYGHEILASYYRARGKNRMEIQQWRKALRLGENKRYWANLAMAYLRTGDKENGYFAARRAYLLDPTWPAGVYSMAAAFDELQMADSALMYYARAILLNPDHDAMRYDFGMLLFRLGRVDDAQKQIEVARKLAPDSAIYHNALAGILIEADHLDQAEWVLKKALKLNPHHVHSRVNLVTVYHKTGRDELALAELARLMAFPDLTPEQRTHIVEMEKRIRTAASLPDSTG